MLQLSQCLSARQVTIHVWACWGVFWANYGDKGPSRIAAIFWLIAHSYWELHPRPPPFSCMQCVWCRSCGALPPLVTGLFALSMLETWGPGVGSLVYKVSSSLVPRPLLERVWARVPILPKQERRVMHLCTPAEFWRQNLIGWLDSYFRGPHRKPLPIVTGAVKIIYNPRRLPLSKNKQTRRRLLNRVALTGWTREQT